MKNYIEFLPDYFISKEGEVFSNKNKDIKMYKLKQQIGNRGYPIVCLYKDGYQTYRMVHRLVAENFIERIDEDLIVNHKDGNKQNNHVSNLEWCTYSENNLHSSRVLKNKHGGWIPVCSINKVTGLITEYPSIKWAGAIIKNRHNLTIKVTTVIASIGNNIRYGRGKDYGYYWIK